MEARISTAIHAPLSASAARTLAPAAPTAAADLRTTWTLLKLTFSVVPVVAGLDKFTNLLTNWELYLNPMLARMLPVSPRLFMGVVGVIEIAAGVLVFTRPRLGAFVVSAWLTCIGLSLLASGQYLDVAVRDLVMAISALVLARLTPSVESPASPRQ